jgi:glyceraldehyde-3-phosphate dehydrogenase (NAD(P))
MTRLRAAVIGCGTIGKRVADAVRRQPDMELAGIGVRSAHPAVLAARLGGARVFCTERDRRADLEAAGLAPAGDLDDLLADCAAVVDCTPSRQAVSRLPRYRAAGLPAVFCGGERHEDVGLTFSTLANYEAAVGSSAVRVASCNTTGLVRVVAGLHRRFGVTAGHAVLVRCATDPDKAGKGVVAGLTVSPGCSHHAEDVARLVPGVRLVTQAVSAPTNRGHVALLGLDLERRPSAADLLGHLRATPRLLAERLPMSTAILRDRFTADGRPRGDRPELVVWPESVVITGGGAVLSVAIHMEAVVVPETIDCLRAVGGREPDRGRCMRTTDEALGIASAGWDYDDPLVVGGAGAAAVNGG